MLFVDGMNGVINHSETVQWLYTLSGSMHRLVVKTALKLLIVFVEYTESNAQLLIQAVNTVDVKRDTKPWSCLIEILEEKNGADVELLVFTMTLINKTLAALPDQDSFYDLTDCLETQGMENIIHRHMNNKGTDSDLKHQFTLYENALRFEDGELDRALPNVRRDRRKLAPSAEEGRKSRRTSGQNMTEATFASTTLSSCASPSPTLECSLPSLNHSQGTPLPSDRASSSQDTGSQSLSPALSPGTGSPAAASNGINFPAAELQQSEGTPSTNRFLQSLAATQREKDRNRLSLSKGRLDTLSSQVSSSPDIVVTSPKARDSPSGFNEGQSLLRQGSLEQHSTLSSDKKFMLDMLYSRNKTGALKTPHEAEKVREQEEVQEGEEEKEPGEGRKPSSKARLSPSLKTEDSAFAKKRKTVKLFWKELKQSESPRKCTFGRGTVWASLDKVTVDTAKLEHLFESKAKELPTAKKILTMVPTDEEKQRIQEAQLANPDVPLGTAEQFLLMLSSISGLTARLQLWAFKLDYESMEKEIAEPLFDLKLGMEQLAKNKTFKNILATLLAIGNFLNCSNVDFDQLSESLVQLERKCKTSWDNLKVIAKHESKAALKNKLTEFLKDCTERIIILKVVHRRIINRFHSFLLYLGQPSHSVRDMKVTQFCRIISEFALEYRTTRERALQQRQKRAAYRERNKTRGKMITETEKFSGAAGPSESSPSPVSTPSSQQQQGQADEEHENMKNLLIPSGEPSGTRRSRGYCSLGRTSPSNSTVSKEDSSGSQDDATDEIMDRLVKSVTQNPNQRPSTPKERKRLCPLDRIDQVMMSYGGLRGAVAFALVILLDKSKVKAKDYFVATTITVVFFTVMFQGLTIKPLVKWLKVKRSNQHKPTLNEELHERAFDHILAAVEDIAGHHGYHHWRDKWEHFDKKYLSQLLMRKSAYRIKDEIWDVYQKLNIRDAMSFVDQGGHVLSSAKLSLPSLPSRTSFSETSVTNLLADEHEWQDREVIQRNMRCRLESFRSTKHSVYQSKGKSRHKKSQKKAVPVVMTMESEEEEEDNSEAEKEEDEGITFVARAADEVLLEGKPSSTLGVCQSPFLLPPSPTCAEKELPWKGDQGDLPACVSLETTKIVPIDLQQAWNQSISSLESLPSPPVSEAQQLQRRTVPPARLEERGAPGALARPPLDPCFQFPECALAAGRSSEEDSAECIQQQELRPLMSPDKQPRPGSSTGSAGARWPVQFNRAARVSLLKNLVTASPYKGSGQTDL
ncbi:UNVERIFIED_CONTAM: hypothetical protein FKN15_011412 [Acipenser sinensis]